MLGVVAQAKAVVKARRSSPDLLTEIPHPGVALGGPLTVEG
jgi:hypothetical protein